MAAQVIAPDGKTHPLDPGTISESPVPAGSPNTFTDARLLRAPLPAAVVGSVVEEVHAVRDTLLTVDAGCAVRLPAVSFVPVRTWRLVVDLPAAMPIQYRLEKAPGVEVTRTSEGDRQLLVFRASLVPALVVREVDQPTDEPRVPAVVVSTGTTWERVAARYFALSDPQWTDDPGRSLVQAQARGLFAADAAQLPRRELVERVVRYLHREIRYTGVEFGQASIRPTSPSLTLQRRYGDCKDLSLLLVALLRELGVPAQLALLASGPGYDIVPELPGWGVFDHAIVRVPDGPDIWIDATDPFNRVGFVPTTVQGRLALPVVPEDGSLVRVATSTSRDNRLRETREITLVPGKGARVVETTTGTGVMEGVCRQLYGRTLPDDLQESMLSYAQGSYETEGPVTARTTDVQNFARPFELVVTVEDARIAACSLQDASLTLPRLPLFQLLPAYLYTFDPDSLDHAAYTAHRRSDLALLTAATMECVHRIIPPLGYRPDALPRSEERKLGPMSYREEYAADSAGVVTVSRSLDPVVGRLTPADVLAFRRAVVDLDKEPLPTVTFQHEGLRLAVSGQLPAAMRCLHAEAERAPKDAYARIRLAKGLLAAGLGEAARDEAKRAVDLAPEDCESWRCQGEVLTHDLLGRLHRPGFDRNGAVACLRRALELCPSDHTVRANLAIQLEFNEHGVQYGPGADLAGAITLLQAVPDEIRTRLGVAGNLPLDLLKAGRLAELEVWARQDLSDSAHLAFWLTAIAAQRDAEAAVTEAIRFQRDDASRSAALRLASLQLVGMRRYEAAGRLLHAGARGQENSASLLAQAEAFGRLQPYAQAARPADDPRSFFDRFLEVLCLDRDTPDSLVSLLPRRLRQVKPEESASVQGMRQLSRALSRYLGSLPLPPESILDIMLARSQVQLDGDPDTGYRVRATTDGSGGALTLFVRREKGRWELFDFDSDVMPAGLGEEAARALDLENTKKAGQLLEWAAELLASAGLDTAATAPFRTLWQGSSTASPGRMRLAAACLLAGGETSEDAKRALLLLRENHGLEATPAERTAIDIARVQAQLRLKHADSLLEPIRDLRRRRPDSSYLFQCELITHLLRQDRAAARACAEERAAHWPKDRAAIRHLMTAAGAAGDSVQVRRCIHRLEQLGPLEPVDFNNWSWYDVMRGCVTDSTLERINRAVLAGGQANAATLHTQAAVYAELNRTVEARDVLLQCMDLMGLNAPNSAIWCVLGRIAEQYGLANAARDAFERVQEDQDLAPGEVDDIYRLARARLATLDNRP